MGKLAHEVGAFVNIVDDLQNGQFITLAIVRGFVAIVGLLTTLNFWIPSISRYDQNQDSVEDTNVKVTSMISVCPGSGEISPLGVGNNISSQSQILHLSRN